MIQGIDIFESLEKDVSTGDFEYITRERRSIIGNIMIKTEGFLKIFEFGVSFDSGKSIRTGDMIRNMSTFIIENFNPPTIIGEFRNIRKRIRSNNDVRRMGEMDIFTIIFRGSEGAIFKSFYDDIDIRCINDRTGKIDKYGIRSRAFMIIHPIIDSTIGIRRRQRI